LFALDVGGVGHCAILAEEENGKEKMENRGAVRATWPEIVEFVDFRRLFAARRLRTEGLQRYRIGISKLLIMRGLIFSGPRKGVKSIE
jgi:hypothetical protein